MTSIEHSLGQLLTALITTWTRTREKEDGPEKLALVNIQSIAALEALAS